MEQLLTLAQFEEAKIRDLHVASHSGRLSGAPRKNGGSATQAPARGSNSTLNSASSGVSGVATNGHQARDRLDRRHRDKEAPGKTEKQGHEDRKKTVSALNKDDNQSLNEDGELRVEKLFRKPKSGWLCGKYIHSSEETPLTNI